MEENVRKENYQKGLKRVNSVNKKSKCQRITANM